MMSVKGAIKSPETTVAINIQTRPFTLSNGQRSRVRGRLPDGRWNNTFVHLVDSEGIGQVPSNNGTNTALKWCVCQKRENWFNRCRYTSLSSIRSLVTFLAVKTKKRKLPYKSKG